MEQQQQEQAQKPSLTIRRRIKARPETVFAAWTDSHMLARWWSPHDCEMIDATLDVRVGGSFRIRFKEPGLGGEIHDVSGTYDAVEQNRLLSFSWHWITTPERVSHVTVTFTGEDDGAGTIFVLYHEQFADEAARDGHETGWNSTLDKLESYCAGL